MSNFTNTDNLIDIRDVIARFEELEGELEAYHDAQDSTLSFEYALQDAANFPEHSDEFEEFEELRTLLESCKGMGGDEQWRGDWYPVMLIHENYFTDYAMGLLADCGDLPRDIPWYIVIDKDATAENIKQDYTCIDYDGETYLTR